MKRYGPLLAQPDALVLGDPGRHHLRMMPDAVNIRTGVESRGLLAWDRVESITMDVPTTRFRLPGFVGTLVLGAVSALAMDDLGIEPDDASMVIVAEGDATTHPLSRHHVGGYWAPTVMGAHRLMRHLIENPEHRALLATPEALIDTAARLARAQG